MEQASIFGTPLGPLLGQEQRSCPVSGMGAAVFDPAVQQGQKLVNGVLHPLGFQTIGTDGKIGPETCGAILYLDKELPTPEADTVRPAWDSLWGYLDARPAIASGCASSYGTAAANWPKRIATPQMPFAAPPGVLPAGITPTAWLTAVQKLQVALNYAMSELGYGIKNTDGTIASLREDGGLDADVCGVIDFVWAQIKAGAPVTSAKALTAALHAPIGSTTVSDVLYPLCRGFQPWPTPIKESDAVQPGEPPAPPPPPSGLVAKASSSTPWLVGGAIGAAALAAVFLLRK